MVVVSFLTSRPVGGAVDAVGQYNGQFLICKRFTKRGKLAVRNTGSKQTGPTSVPPCFAEAAACMLTFALPACCTATGNKEKLSTEREGRSRKAVAAARVDMIVQGAFGRWTYSGIPAAVADAARCCSAIVADMIC